MDRSIDSDARQPDEREPALGPARDEHQPAIGRASAEAIIRLRATIDAVSQDHPTFSELMDRLERSGVRAIPSLLKSGRLNGMSFEVDGVRYKGSDIGRAYTARGLQRCKDVRYDPGRDDARLREARELAREHPARSFSRSLDLRERSMQVREYDGLSPSDRETLREVGRFRAVLVEDFVGIQYRGERHRWEQDLAKLAAQRLMETRSIVIAMHDRNHQAHTRSLEVAVLTKKGKNLLARFDHPTREARQVLYAGFVKPREIAHDAAIYRMYQAEAAHIQAQGGHVKRIVLDFELKKKAYSPLARARKLPPAEYSRKQAEIAAAHGLSVVDGKIRLPDLRIEYETAAGDAARVDLELATEHYRSDHMAAKERAGFKIYADSRSFPPGGSYGRSGVVDDHDIDIFSF